eukprot:4448660-Alexandrium_andersonii.AAC.1
MGCPVCPEMRDRFEFSVVHTPFLFCSALVSELRFTEHAGQQSPRVAVCRFGSCRCVSGQPVG